MRRLALPFALAALVCLPGCAEDRGHHHDDGDAPSGGACTELGCTSAVAIHVGALLAPLPSAAPLAIHACVDMECFDVRYSPASATAGATCVPSSAAAAAVPTVSCVLSPGGQVSLQVTLLADPGVSPVVAVSVSAGGQILTSHAKTAALEARTPNGASCGPVCSQGEITF